MFYKEAKAPWSGAMGPGIRPKCPCSPGLYPTLNDDHMTSVSSLTNMGVNSKRCKYQTKSFVFVELSLEPQEDEI